MAHNFKIFQGQINILIETPDQNYIYEDGSIELHSFSGLTHEIPIGVYLIYSVLYGEYYSNFETFKSSIPDLISRINYRIVKLQNFSSGIAESDCNILKNSVKALKIYESLSKIAEKSLNGEHNRIGISFIDELRKRETLWDSNTTETNNLFLLFAVSVALAEIDMFLDCSRKTREELKKIAAYLETNQLAILMHNGREIQNILREKASYLFEKIDIRLRKKDYSKQNDLILEYREKLKEYQYFGHFLNLTLSHYLEDKPNQRFVNYCNSLPSSPILCLSEVHSKNKAFRKGIVLNQSFHKDTCELQNRIEKEKKENIESKNLFNVLSLQSASCLIFNTILQENLKADEEVIIQELLKDASSSTLEKYLSSIEANHFENNKKDYHAYKKFLEFLDKLTDRLRDKPFDILTKDWKRIETDKDKDDEIQSVNKRVNKIREIYEKAYQKFEESLDWCEERSYKPIYLSSDECRTTNGNFLASSYILPDDYELIRNNWNGTSGRLKGNIRSLKNRISLDLRTELFDNKYKKELDSRDFKAVTALALFISVSSFILGSVRIMEGRDVLTSMTLMLVFGTGLLMFNLLIYWITNKNETWHLEDLFFYEKTKGRFWRKVTLRSLAIFLILGIFLGLILYKTQDYKNAVDMQNKKLQTELDTLNYKIQLLKIKTDSLSKN